MVTTTQYRLFVIFILNILIAHSAMSQKYFQKGFVVNVNQDTTWGFVKIIGNLSAPEGCHFKTEVDAESKTLIASDITAFGIHGYRDFKAISNNGLSFFVQVLVSGEVNLFTDGKIFFAEREQQLHRLEIITKTIYDQHGGATIHTIKNYINTLKILLNDCPDLSGKIENASLTESSLVSVIQKFNGCVNSSSLIYKSDIPWIAVNFCASVGLAYSVTNVNVSSNYLSFYGYYEKANFNVFKPMPSIGVMASSPRVLSNLAVSLEARYMKYTVHTLIIDENATYDQNDISMKYSCLIIPITAYYQFDIHSRVSLSIRAGLLTTYFRNAELITRQRSSQAPNGGEQIRDALLFNSKQKGFTAGVGLHTKIHKIKIYCEPRLENIGSLLSSINVFMNNNVYSVSLGVKF